MNELDPPEHLFRIRLVCTLLDTCGQYFDRGTSKKRLDCFLVYFQVRDDFFFRASADLLLSLEILLFQERTNGVECINLSIPIRNRTCL